MTIRVQTTKVIVTAGPLSMPIRIGSVIDLPDSTVVDGISFFVVPGTTPLTPLNQLRADVYVGGAI